MGYSAGIHGLGSLGAPGSNLVVGTSACSLTNACAPIPYTKLTPKFLEAKGIMYIIDLSEIMDAAIEMPSEVVQFLSIRCSRLGAFPYFRPDSLFVAPQAALPRVCP